MTRSRNRRLRLIPSHLPLIRDKLVEYERVSLKEEMAAHSQYERSMEAAWNFADNLAVAQLWWISRDMTALAEWQSWRRIAGLPGQGGLISTTRPT